MWYTFFLIVFLAYLKQNKTLSFQNFMPACLNCFIFVLCVRFNFKFAVDFSVCQVFPEILSRSVNDQYVKHWLEVGCRTFNPLAYMARKISIY